MLQQLHRMSAELFRLKQRLEGLLWKVNCKRYKYSCYHIRCLHDASMGIPTPGQSLSDVTCSTLVCACTLSYITPI